MNKRRLLTTILPIAAVLAAAVTAWAFYTQAGTGSASASVADLSTPSVTVPATSTASVPVSWTAAHVSTGSFDSQIGYSVERSTNGGTTWGAAGGGCTGSQTGTSCTDTAPDGNAIYRVTANFRSWSALSSNSSSVSVDAVHPTVSSISYSGSSPTNASSVSYTVTFSESVSGVDSSDFSAHVVSGSIAPGAISVTGSGATRTVTVDTGAGDGTIRLDLIDDGSIHDAAGNALSGGNFTTGDTVAIEKTAPQVSAISKADSDPTNAATVHWNVTFSKSVTGVDAGDFQLAGAGATGASITGLTGNGSSYTVTASTANDGALGLNLVDDDSIVDAVGNKLGGTGASNGNFTGAIYTIDRNAPALQTLTMLDGDHNGKVDHVTATFNEPIQSSTDTAPWTLTSAPGGATLASVSTSGSTATLTLNEGTVTTAVGGFQISLAASSTGIRDAVGNQASFANTAPADGAAPVVTSVNRADANPTNAASVNWTATFSESVSGVGAGDFSLVPTTVTGTSISTVSAGPGSSYTVTASTGSGSGSLGLNLVDDDSIVDGAGNKLGGTGTGNGSLTGQVYSIDKTAPALTKLEMFDTNGNGKVDQVKATFDETLAPSTNTAQWALVGVPSQGSLSSVSTSGTVATLTLTEGTGTADTSVGTFTVALAANSAGIRDSVGNAASFAAQAPTDKAPPVVRSLTLANGPGGSTALGRVDAGDTITAIYSEPIAVNTLCSTWTGNTSNQADTTGNDVVVTLTDGGASNDTMSVTGCGGLHFGTLNLGATGYVSGGNLTFSGTGAAKSSLSYNATTKTFVVTLGSKSGTGTPAAVASSAPTLTYDTALTDTIGNNITGSLTLASGQQF